MTGCELIVKLLFQNIHDPVVFNGPEYADGLPCEITSVEHQAYAPDGGIAARGSCIVITANPDA